jgi:MSHA biogenesis protein MshM
MYYHHFGLSEPPFKITPNTEFFFAGGNRGAILDALIYAISHGEGIVKVTGEVGSGKTMLCRMLQARLPEHVESVYLANPNLAPEDILHAIAFEMQLPVTAQSSRFEVLQALQNYLLARHTEGKHVVVFVEEAQGVPLPTLEEIRLLSNLETERDKLLQIVLFGQPELDVNISRAEMRQLRERITHSFDLPPLTADEIHEYLAFRLRTAGYHGPDLFGAAVIRYMADVSSGLTRRVNILADKSMLAAFADNTHNITLKHAKTAANDSEFGTVPKQPLSWLKPTIAALALLALGIAIGLLFNRSNPAVSSAPASTLTPPAPQTAVLPKAQPEHKSEPATTTPIAAKPAADALENRLAETDAWLEKQVPNTLTIQLVGSNSPQMIEHFIATLGRSLEANQVYVFRTQVGGKPSMTVTYGSFASRKEAAQALDGMTDNFKRNHPILRSIKGIRAEVEQARNSTPSQPGHAVQ